jgi:hypothetical protein
VNSQSGMPPPERTGYPVLCTGDGFAATGISVLRPPAESGAP